MPVNIKKSRKDMPVIFARVKNLTKYLRHDISNHTMHDKLRCVTAEEFYTVISHSMSDDDRRCFLSDYSLDSYINMNHRVLMYNNHAGFAVKEGDIVSVFSSRQNPVKQSLDIMMPSASSLGGGKT